MDNPIESCAKAVEAWQRGNASLESFAWSCAYALEKLQERVESLDAANVDLEADNHDLKKEADRLTSEVEALKGALKTMKQDREVEL